jgi:hypothetical protein
MDAVRSTETSVNVHQTIGRDIPWYSIFQSHCRENFKFLKIKFLWRKDSYNLKCSNPKIIEFLGIANVMFFLFKTTFRRLDSISFLRRQGLFRFDTAEYAFCLMTDAESRLWNIIFNKKNKTIDNAQSQ